MSVYDNMDLPEDDTEPDEHGNEPRPCVVCDLDPPEGGPVQTTNRGLFSVNHKLWIDPVCTAHDTAETATKVAEIYDYGGTQFVAEAINLGVFTREDADEHLPDDAATELNATLTDTAE